MDFFVEETFIGSRLRTIWFVFGGTAITAFGVYLQLAAGWANAIARAGCLLVAASFIVYFVDPVSNPASVLYAGRVTDHATGQYEQITSAETWMWRLQLLFVVLGTLMWGFGDLLNRRQE